MIRETLTAIGQAGRHALVQISPSFEVATRVTQVREWSFAMPDLARVTVANSPIHQIYVGLSRPLAALLEQRDGMFETLLEEFKQALIMRVPAKRPIGAWQILDSEGDTRVLRGVRSFILRQQTSAGNLYLMADVASRCEYEVLRQEDWEALLASHLLPQDLARNDCVDGPVALDRVSTYLARCEHDLELLVPGADDNVHSCNAVMLGRTKQDGHGCMLLSLDVSKEIRSELQPGIELEGSFGAAGRVFRFRTRCLKTEDLSLDGLADLPCYLFELPERYHLDQRRRYFRVQPGAPLTARIHVLPPEAAGDDDGDPPAAPPERPDSPPDDAIEARVDDLSFSGAGLVIEGEETRRLVEDCLVALWIEGDGLKQATELTALVRRHEIKPLGRGRVRTSVGVEFVVSGPNDRQSTQVVRQYVMAQQRRLLSSRSADAQPV